ncbi:16S rRNA (cytidine(1402)-2'-O)-methyltransferase [Candidatus Kaiserbacteria bacterium CG10_big_fil_rev_8_21_14_0_10_45_20]|uniref:Ribosomal RNA small subunit methyltransferase I n=1 Tax=Candidatus Kaiserbacteria bacterium CG10_big_fil_rev_8_21_14_0_10_45_20 TaxID=1974607 RepID=A0A2H0UFY3_9BACT|nr:MAG: 16S rRNA (cytidine(1402)-2'-O)-methyltransferase [Candidatus Kaiserbacteria bacterium CG10_big_fil_rev_8_21_14_0_10_45_20]
MKGILYIMATPIGNMEDITLRALRILGEVDLLLAEDTRVTGKLLARHNISVKMKSYHQRSADSVATEIIALLNEGKALALVTDAGTPGVADPGNELIARVIKEAPQVAIEPIPGASSLTSALSVCGFPTNAFVFMGFLPHKKGRQTQLNHIQEEERTVVLFESPHRIGKLLAELEERAPDRPLAIFREITKMHESHYRGTVKELHAQFTKGDMTQKGEYVVILGPSPKPIRAVAES